MKTIELTQGKIALVDDADFEQVNQYNWYAAKDCQTWYAQRGFRLPSGKWSTMKMHQIISPKGLNKDHRDGNGLNNQRSNLRLATVTQNARNRSRRAVSKTGFKGIWWQTKTKNWGARIGVDGRYIFLGMFSTPEQAAMAYDLAAIKFHGEFARLNFPGYPHVLAGTRVYTIGYMEAKNGEGWRKKVVSELKHLGITFFSPYDKPFVIDIPEDEAAQKQLVAWRAQGEFDKVAERMREIRVSDLRLVDISDWLIAYIDPSVVTYGTIEELTTAVREKKPVFVVIEGGRKKTPLWLLGMIPPKYFYDSLDDALGMIKRIDSGEVELSSDRWKLLKKELR